MAGKLAAADKVTDPGFGNAEQRSGFPGVDEVIPGMLRGSVRILHASTRVRASFAQAADQVGRFRTRLCTHSNHLIQQVEQIADFVVGQQHARQSLDHDLPADPGLR